jgi:starch synthase
MYIVMIAAELAPVAKAGGLADAVAGLAQELSAQDHRVEVLLPGYDCLRRDLLWEPHKVQDLWTPVHDDWVHCDVVAGQTEGLDCCFIEPHCPQGYFQRGRIHGEPDDPERFAFFSRAALEFLHRSGRWPDVLHCHDWHTGLVPVLLDALFRDTGLGATGVCYTLHNLGHQGCCGVQVLRQVGLEPESSRSADALRDAADPQRVNPVQGGIVYADYVTTVSPRYAWEVQNSEQGEGLQPLLQRHAEKFGGILNGIDYEVWNPQSDPHIAFSYKADTLQRKARNKSDLRRRLGLEETQRPVVAAITRLMPQKGPELIRHAADCALAEGGQCVILGSTQDPAIEQGFRILQERHGQDRHCRIVLEHDEELAHRIYAGADILVVPSRYEPCGLSQLIAMRYGAVPVVRRVGGLADTVFDANHSERGFHQRNGYVFDHYDPAGLESALKRAIGLWREYPEYFRQLRINGMGQDHSWAEPAQRYLDVYAHIAGRRNPA